MWRSNFVMLSLPERALRDRLATVAKLFQKLEFFGKGKLSKPLAHGALAFQDFAHPIVHG
jgi:hypothetical protein